MSKKVRFIEKVPQKIQTDPKEKKHWKGVRQIRRYKQPKNIKTRQTTKCKQTK